MVSQTQVPDGWKTVRLGDFAPFMYGKGLRQKDRDASGSIPVLGSNGIVGYHGTSWTEGPTIVVGRKGTVGAVHYSPGPCWPIDTTFYLTDDDNHVIRFKYYLLRWCWHSEFIAGYLRNDSWTLNCVTSAKAPSHCAPRLGRSSNLRVERWFSHVRRFVRVY